MSSLLPTPTAIVNMEGQNVAPVQQVDNAMAGEHKQQEHAAQMIQRNYRGYRERRQLQGIGLDANARWAEVGCPVLPVVDLKQHINMK